MSNSKKLGNKAAAIPEVEILYEDKDIVAVNKPAGLMVHADGHATGPFLTDWVLKKYPRAVKVGETMLTPDGQEIVRPGIVHRLDRETSGVILIAKTKAGHECLKKQFQARTIVKKYNAFVWGELLEEFGTIDRPIGRNGSDFRKWSAQRGKRGEIRSAETYWTRIGKPFTAEVDDGASVKKEKFTLVEAEPKTGRTHQIRVHFVAIHHPVVGDKLYAPKRPNALGFERTALHAREITFQTVGAKGEAGKAVTVKADFPKDFEKAMKKFVV